jgi:hypothetical protein
LFFVRSAGVDQTIKSFLDINAGSGTIPLTINRGTKSKKFNEAMLGRFRKMARITVTGQL